MPHRATIEEHGAIFESAVLNLGLASAIPLSCDGESVHATFALQEGEEAVFLLRPLKAGEECRRSPSNTETQEVFERTVDYWHRWLSKCTYTGRWREMVYRSALTLKLMTFEPTGAIIASPTCSLPESIGGGRNWDYRYTWIRDCRLYAVWLVENRLHGGSARLHEMAGSASRVKSRPLAHCRSSTESTAATTSRSRLSIIWTAIAVPGPSGSATAPILNCSSIFSGSSSIRSTCYNKHVMPISYDVWIRLRHGLDWLCDNWQQPDEGIWEVRGGRRHFVYSKLMCWVAMDRGIRLADKRSFPADRDRWQRVRDQIYEDIMSKGWSQKRQAFVQHYDGDSLDASNLIMPMVFFMAPNDPRMLSTLHAINRSPKEGGLVSDGLVYRYDSETGEDGLKGREGTFTMCSFWLVEALTRAGHVDRAKLTEARLLFERMLGHANHLGLYAEEIGGSGEALGNFPQAFTHFALISAAIQFGSCPGRQAP